MFKFQGKIKSIPVTEISEGMQVIVHKVSAGTPAIKIIKSIDGDLWIESIGYLTGKYSSYKFSFAEMLVVAGVKSLVIEYDKSYSHPAGVFRGTMIQVPLHYSHWQSAIDNAIIDANTVVEFEFNYPKTPKFGNIEIAKIVSIETEEKRFLKHEIPFEAISNVLDYCEINQIYDKLSKHGDFYYKLKKFFDENNR